jgi:hypothetical protein
MNVPLDDTHWRAAALRAQINRWAAVLKARARQWEPRPMPKGWTGFE